MAERVVKIIIRGDSGDAENSIRRLSNALRKMDEDLARSAKTKLQGIDVSQMQRSIETLRRSGKQFYDDQVRDAKRASEATKQSFREQEKAVSFASKTLDKYDNQLAKLGGYDSEVRRLNKSLADPSVAKHLDDNTKALLREKAALIDTQRETQKLAKEREKLNKARIQKVENFGNSTRAVGQGIQTTGMAMTAAVTAPVAGFAAYVIKVGSEYETAMNIFQKATEATNDEMQRAEKLAIALGNDMTLPGVSAKDAAEAMTELGKAGMTASQAMDAAQGTLRLATAAGISAGEAAEITANALNAFKLPASEATRVADLLAGAANASSAEITDVAASMQQAGAIFAAAHVPIEDLTTAIGLMANSGIKGSDAGTSLKSMLLKLQSPSKAAAATLDELGIKVYDAQGKMKPMRDIVEQLTDKTKNLTQQQKDQALATIFGSDAIRAANILINEGTAGWDKMSENVQRANAAQELAAARTKGLAGAWEAVKSQFETFALVIYNRVKAPLTELLIFIGTFVANIMDGFTSLSPTVQTFIIAFAGIAAAIGPVLVVVGTLVVGIGSLITTIAGAAAAVGGFAVLGGIIAGVVAAFALLSAGVGIAVGVVYELVEAWDKGFGPIASYVAITIGAILTAFSPILGLPVLIAAVAVTIYKAWETNFGGLRDFVSDVWDGIVNFFNAAMAEIVALTYSIMGDVLAWWYENYPLIQETITKVQTNIENAVRNFLNALREFWANNGDEIMSIVKSVWNIISTVVRTGVQIILQVVKGVMQIINGDWSGVWETFKDILQRAIDASRSIFDSLANIVGQAIKMAIDALLGAGTADAIINWVMGIGDSVSSGFDTVTNTISDAFNAIIEPFQEIFSVINEEVTNWLTENQELINQAVQPFKDAFDAIYNTVSEVLSAIGEYISSWWDTILSYWESATTSISEFFSAAWDALAGIVSPALEAVSNVISTVGNAIGTIWSSIWNSAKEIFSAVWQAIVSTVRLVVQTVLGVIKSILQLITGDWRGAWNTAKSVVQNIFESIGTILTNLGTRVWNALKAIVQTVVDVGAFRERTVNGTVVDAAGNAITSAAIKFKLTTPLGYTATHVVVDREFTATTNGQGQFSINLWCDEDSLAAVNYVVTFPVANNGQPDAQHLASFSLAYDDGAAIQIGTLIAMGLPSPTPQELLYQSIDARIEATGIISAGDSIELSDKTLSGFGAKIKAIDELDNDGNYSFVQSDNGKILLIQTSPVLLKINEPLSAGFSCTVIMVADASPQIVSSNGQVRNKNGDNAVGGINAVVTIIRLSEKVFLFTGDTTQI